MFGNRGRVIARDHLAQPRGFACGERLEIGTYKWAATIFATVACDRKQHAPDQNARPRLATKFMEIRSATKSAVVPRRAING